MVGAQCGAEATGGELGSYHLSAVVSRTASRLAGSTLDRRTILRVAAGAALMTSVTLATTPFVAFAEDTPFELEPLERVCVPSTSGVNVLAATALGVTIVCRDAMPQLSVLARFDSRLYRAASAPEVRGDRGSVPLRMLSSRTARGVTELRLQSVADVPAGRHLLFLGEFGAVYPADLVRDPHPGLIKVTSIAHSRHVPLSTPDPVNRVPWGATAATAWQETQVGDSTVWLPTMIVITSVGPGDIPKGCGINLQVDSRAFSHLGLGNHLSGTSGLVATSLSRSDRILTLKCRFNSPISAAQHSAHALETKLSSNAPEEHAPAVLGFDNPTTFPGQRTTRQESVSSSEAGR